MESGTKLMPIREIPYYIISFKSRVAKYAIINLTCVYKSNEMPSRRHSLKKTGTRIDRKLGWCT